VSTSNFNEDILRAGDNFLKLPVTAASQNAVEPYTDDDLNRWKREINAGPIIASRIALRRENAEWVALCPFHREKTPSFKVFKSDDGFWLFHCFGCSAQGNVFQFIQKFDKVSFPEAVATVLELAGAAGPAEVETQPTKPKELRTFPIEQYTPTESALEGSAIGQKWITDRGITMETARRFHLGFVQDATTVAGTNHPWAKMGWVLFPTLSDDGRTVTAVKYRSIVAKKDMIGDKSVSGILRAQNTATTLYNLREVNATEDVFIAEGEPDTLVLSQAGVPCVGYPSAQYRPTSDECAVLMKANRRFLAGDTDTTGTEALNKLWKKLPENTFRIEWPNHRKDANDVLLNECEGNPDKFSALLATLKAKARGTKSSVGDYTKPPRLRPGKDIKPKKVKWLWNERVPLGKITLLAGNPDNGKSLAANSLAASVTTGGSFPDSPNLLPPSDVLMLVGEDDIDDTAVPRLMAAKADMSKIHFADTDTDEAGEIRLDKHLPVVEQWLNENPNIRLVVIDPISNYLGDVSMVAEQEVRSVLIPLKSLASRKNVAVVLVMHLNKKSELDAISRVSGAMAFIGVARCSWLFVRDEADEDGAVRDSFSMVRIKNNLAKASSGGLAYHIDTAKVPVEGETEPAWAPFVVWGGIVQKSADDALKHPDKQHGPGRPPLQHFAAMQWLTEQLQDGAKPLADIEHAGVNLHGFSKRTLREVRNELGVITFPSGKQKAKDGKERDVFSCKLRPVIATTETL